jgi:predicted dehydrogenase
MGLRHLRAYAEMERDGVFHSYLTGVYDPDQGLLERRVDWYQSHVGRRPKCYATLDQAFNDDAVKSIDIVAPSDTHHTLALKALQAGRDVFTEKPLAVTVRAGRLVVEAARASNRVVGVAHNYRFFPSNRALAHAIHAGAIGDPFFMVSRYVADIGGKVATSWIEGTTKPSAHDVKITGSRAALAMGVHETDILRYWFGDVAEVYGVVRTFDATVFTDSGEPVVNQNDDSAFALLTLESGVVAQCTISFAGRAASMGDRAIYGSKGTIQSDNWASWDQGYITGAGGRTAAADYVARFVEGLSPSDRVRLLPEGTHRGDFSTAFDDPMRYGIAGELEQFAAAVLNGERPEVDGEEGLKSDAVSFAILESSLINRPVRVADVESEAISAWQAPINLELGL